MSRIRSFGLMLVAAACIAADGRSIRPHLDEILIEGTWELDSAVGNGVELGTDHNRIVVHGRQWKAKGDTFAYVLRPNHRPKQVDWVLKDKVWKGIYELKDGTLRLCFCKPGNPRPTEFQTVRGDNRRLHLRRRVKAPSE